MVPVIRHVVVFQWTEAATEEQKQRARDEVARLPGIVPSIRGFVIGADAGISPGASDFAVTADFDDVDGYAAYRDHPTHRQIIEQHIRPIMASRAAVQLEW